MPLDLCGDNYVNQMHASVCVDLPSDEFEEAAAKLKVRPIWEGFLKALIDAKVPHVAKLETVATRAKPAATGTRRGRKAGRQTPSLVPPTVDLLQEPGGEAA